MGICTQSTVIEINSLRKRYGTKEVLKSLDMNVCCGDFVAIMGKSGSGKSTLINIIGLLEEDYEGEYRLFGEDMKKMSDRKLTKHRCKDIGYVFQAYNLINDCTVKENVLLPASYAKNKVSPETLEALFEELEIAELANKRAELLSGGEKQRVGIARAIINNPRLVIADEPTGSLDEENSEKIFRILKRLNANGTTIILVTHNHQLAEKAGRQLVLSDGILKEQRS